MDLASFNNANQIKGERQLLHLKDAVDFNFNKSDDFEIDRLEKEKNQKRHKRRSAYLSGKVGEITAETARQRRQDAYSRRNCLLIDGIPENKNENTDVLAMCDQ